MTSSSPARCAPRQALWRAWTDPELLKEWWCPKPWTTDVRAFDLRPGGAFHTFMRGPDGGTSDNPGCFLEIVPEARIAFTSMLAGGWRPQVPWLGFTAIVTMADDDAGCRYDARVMHPDAATRERRGTRVLRRLEHLHHAARRIRGRAALKAGERTVRLHAVARAPRIPEGSTTTRRHPACTVARIPREATCCTCTRIRPGSAGT